MTLQITFQKPYMYRDGSPPTWYYITICGAKPRLATGRPSQRQRETLYRVKEKECRNSEGESDIQIRIDSRKGGISSVRIRTGEKCIYKE
jgi:hypothetical protein